MHGVAPPQGVAKSVWPWWRAQLIGGKTFEPNGEPKEQAAEEKAIPHTSRCRAADLSL